MLTLPHALQDVGPRLRAEVLAFLRAVERARRFGLLVDGEGTGAMPAGGQDGTAGAEWAPGQVGIIVAGLAAFAAEDMALLRRGVLHLLASHGDASSLRQAQALAAPAAMVERVHRQAADERPDASGFASTNFREAFHLHLWFVDPVDDPLLEALADALDTLEHLAVGLRPLVGAVFADMGATSLSLLEPRHVQIWMDGLHADPSDWHARVGRMLERLHRRRPLAAIRYEPS